MSIFDQSASVSVICWPFRSSLKVGEVRSYNIEGRRIHRLEEGEDGSITLLLAWDVICGWTQRYKDSLSERKSCDHRSEVQRVESTQNLLIGRQKKVCPTFVLVDELFLISRRVFPMRQRLLLPCLAEQHPQDSRSCFSRLKTKQYLTPELSVLELETTMGKISRGLPDPPRP